MSVEAMFLVIIFCLVVFWISIMLHEIGHVYVLRWYGYKNSKVEDIGTAEEWGGYKVEIPDDLTSQQYTDVLLTGVGLGVIPILIASVWVPQILALLLVYFYGCREDLKNIWKETI